MAGRFMPKKRGGLRQRRLQERSQQAPFQLKRKPTPRRTRQLLEQPAQEPAKKKQKLASQLLIKALNRADQSPTEYKCSVKSVPLTDRVLQHLNTCNQKADLPQQDHGQVNHKAGACDDQKLEDFLRYNTRHRLRSIQLFAEDGGPDLTDLRGFRHFNVQPVITMTSTGSTRQQSAAISTQYSASFSQQTSSTATPNTRNTGPYQPKFEPMLTDSGIYVEGYEYPDGSEPCLPANWEDIKEKLAKRRPSLSKSNFPEHEFIKFRKLFRRSRYENDVTQSVTDTLKGSASYSLHSSAKLGMKNLSPLTPEEIRITAGNPDMFFGIRPDLVTSKVRKDLGHYIQPTTTFGPPIAPNFFLAFKGPKGTSQVALLQACHDGALGARAMHRLQLYDGSGNEPETLIYDNKARVITCSFANGFLSIYTSYAAKKSSGAALPSEKPDTEYRMHQLRSISLIDSVDSLRDGLNWFRNGIDWTKEERDALIKTANERAYGYQPAEVERHGGLENSEAVAYGQSEDHLRNPCTDSFVNRSDQLSIIPEDEVAAESDDGNEDQHFDHGHGGKRSPAHRPYNTRSSKRNKPDPLQTS